MMALSNTARNQRPLREFPLQSIRGFLVFKEIAKNSKRIFFKLSSVYLKLVYYGAYSCCDEEY